MHACLPAPSLSEEQALLLARSFASGLWEAQQLCWLGIWDVTYLGHVSEAGNNLVVVGLGANTSHQENRHQILRRYGLLGISRSHTRP